MKKLIALALLAALPALADQDALVVSLQAAPANRAAMRRALETAGQKRLQLFKDQGALRSYQILLSRHLDSRSFDALVVLGVADAGRWKKIERESPAGLPAEVLALASAVESVPATLARHGASAQQPAGEPAFLVIPYEVAVSSAEYAHYLDEYVIPQLAGWVDEGALRSHSVYLAKYPAGRPWQSLLVLEYASEAALATREAVLAKVRARLAANARWKAASDNKKHVRVERPPVLADLVYGREER